MNKSVATGCKHGVACFNNKIGVDGGGVHLSSITRLGLRMEGGPWKNWEVCIIPRWWLVDSWVLRGRRVGGRES